MPMRTDSLHGSRSVPTVSRRQPSIEISLCLAAILSLAPLAAAEQPRAESLSASPPAVPLSARFPKATVQPAGRQALQDVGKSAYPRTHYQRALYLRQKGDRDAALIEFLKATQENPRLVKAFYEQAVIFRERGYLKLAESALEQALAVKPDYQQARILLATVRLEQGNLGGAVNELSRSLGLTTGKQEPSRTSQGKPPGTWEISLPEPADNADSAPASGLPAPPASVMQTLHSALPEPAYVTPSAPPPGETPPVAPPPPSPIPTTPPERSPENSVAPQVMAPDSARKEAANQLRAPAVADRSVFQGTGNVTDAGAEPAGLAARPDQVAPGTLKAGLPAPGAQEGRRDRRRSLLRKGGLFERMLAPLGALKDKAIPSLPWLPARASKPRTKDGSAFKQSKAQDGAPGHGWLDRLLHALGSEPPRTALKPLPDLTRRMPSPEAKHTKPPPEPGRPKPKAPPAEASQPITMVIRQPPGLNQPDVPAEPSVDKSFVPQPQPVRQAHSPGPLPSPRAPATVPPAAVAPRPTPSSLAESPLALPLPAPQLAEATVRASASPAIIKPARAARTPPPAGAPPAPTRLGTSAGPKLPFLAWLPMPAILSRPEATPAPPVRSPARASVRPPLALDVMQPAPMSLTVPDNGPVPRVVEPPQVSEMPVPPAKMSRPRTALLPVRAVGRQAAPTLPELPQPVRTAAMIAQQQPVPAPRGNVEPRSQQPQPRPFFVAPEQTTADPAVATPQMSPLIKPPPVPIQPLSSCQAVTRLPQPPAATRSPEAIQLLPRPAPPTTPGYQLPPVPRRAIAWLPAFPGAQPLPATPDRQPAEGSKVLVPSACAATVAQPVAPQRLPVSQARYYDPPTAVGAPAIESQPTTPQAPVQSPAQNSLAPAPGSSEAPGAVATVPSTGAYSGLGNSQSRLLAMAGQTRLPAAYLYSGASQRAEPPAQCPKPEDTDPVTKRMKYLAEHGTASLKPGEAFMFSEETGEAVLFQPNGETLRRKIAEPKDPHEVVLTRRPDIAFPQQLKYNLSLLARLLPRQDQPPAQNQQAPPTNFTLSDVLTKHDGFFGWLKQLFGM